MPDASNVVTDIKVSELPVAEQANADDQLEANQAGTTRSITVSQLAAAAAAVIADPMLANGADGACGINDLAALDATLADQIAELPRLQIWAKTSIDVGSLIPGSDTCDPMPFIQKIFAAFDTPGMQGRHFIFGRQRAWNFQTRPSTGLGPHNQYLTAPQRCTLEWQREWDFSAYLPSSSPTFMRRDGTYGPTIATTGDLAKGQRTITVAPGGAAGLVYGQRLLLRATSLLGSLVGAWTLSDATPASGAAARAEELIVKSVSGDTITFENYLQDTYPATTTPVLQTYVGEPEIRLVNPTAIGPGWDGTQSDRFIDIRRGRNLIIEGGRLSNFAQPLRINGMLGGRCSDLQVFGIAEGVAGGGITLNDGVSNFLVENCTTWGGGQMFMLSIQGDAYGVMRDVTFANCTANGPVDGFTTHNTHERIVYNNCQVNSPSGKGFDIRVPNVTMSNCTVRNGGGNAVMLRPSANNFVCDGLRVDKALSGVCFQDDATEVDYHPSNITIRNCLLERIGGSGSKGALAFDYPNNTAGTFPALGPLNLAGNTITVTDNTVPITVKGKWANPVVEGNTISGADGFSPTATSHILIAAPTGGTTGDGPSSPVIRRNRQSSGYSFPSVSGYSGVVIQDQEMIGTSMTQPGALTANTTLLGSQSGQVFSNTGASAGIVVTLPAFRIASLKYEIYVTDAQQVRITTADLSTIRMGSISVGTDLRSSTVGAWVRLTQLSATLWMAEVDNVAAWTQDFSPYALGSDLIAWWDIGSPPSGTTTVRWTDIVSRSLNVQQSTAGALPTWDASAVDFTGNKWLNSNTLPTGTPVGATAGCIWASVDQTNLVADTGQKSIFAYGAVTATQRALIRSVNTGVNRCFSSCGDGTSKSATNSLVDFSGPHWCAQVYDGAVFSTRVDGTASSSVASIATTASTRIRIGSDIASTPTLFANMKIKRVLITKLLSAPNQTALEAWLTARV
jgi:hypothetical protein